jgi:hypothetical protein
MERGAPYSDEGSVLFGRDSPTENVCPGRVKGLQSDGVCPEQQGTLKDNTVMADCREDGQCNRKTVGVRVLSDLLQEDADSWSMMRSSSTGSMTTRTSSAASSSPSLDRGQRSPSEQLPSLKESGMSIDFLNNPALAEEIQWGSGKALLPVGAAGTMDLVSESTGEGAADFTWGELDERLSSSEISELGSGGGGGGGVDVCGVLDERLPSSEMSKLGGVEVVFDERLPSSGMGRLRGGGGTGGLDERLSSSEIRGIGGGGVGMEGSSAWCAADETPDGSTRRSSCLSCSTESPFSQSVEPGDILSLHLCPSFPLSTSPAPSPLCTSLPEPRLNHPTWPFDPLEFSGASGRRGSLCVETAACSNSNALKAKLRGAMTRWKSMDDMRGKDHKVGRLDEEEDHFQKGRDESLTAPQEAAGEAAIEAGGISAMFDFVPSSVEMARSDSGSRMRTKLPAVDGQAKKKMLESMISSIETEMTDSSKSLFGLPKSGKEMGFTRYGGPARRRNIAATATTAQATTAEASDEGAHLSCRRSERSSSSACQDDAPVFQGYLMYEDVCSMILILLFICCGCTWLIL